MSIFTSLFVFLSLIFVETCVCPIGRTVLKYIGSRDPSTLYIVVTVKNQSKMLTESTVS